MGERKTTQITAPDIDANTLFGLYMLIPGNENKEFDDFINFMSEESVDRQLFLDKYCSYKYVEIEETVVLQYKLKAND